MKFTYEEIEEIEGWVKGTTLPKVIEHLIDGCVEAWKAADDRDAREMSWVMVQCIREVHGKFASIVSDQKIDQFNARRFRANDWAMPRASTEDL